MTVNAITTNRIHSAIAQASSRTGIDFDYLLGQARLESGLNANARAGTSSASGLYQFIEQSWLAVVKKHGAEHGLGWAADSIGRGANGRLSIGDAGAKAAILNLRNDPAVASLMAAEHASDNKTVLEGKLGRAATGTDLYMAHFLGLGGASKFLSSMQGNPGAIGATMFPAAAAANRGVFYKPGGEARSLSEVYDRFAAKLGAGAGDTGTVAARFASQSLDMNGTTVVTGGNESAGDAMAWASATLDRFGAGKFGSGDSGRGTNQAASLMRPTPDTARLAYLMLANLGG